MASITYGKYIMASVIMAWITVQISRTYGSLCRVWQELQEVTTLLTSRLFFVIIQQAYTILLAS